MLAIEAVHAALEVANRKAIFVLFEDFKEVRQLVVEVAMLLE